MASRRDQLHSYQFLLQRVVSSIMVHETDPEQAPLRRGVGAIFAGAMIAVVVAAGFGVAGVITGSIGNRWQREGAIVIERETGATYVFRGGTLQPVLNYASARLVSGSTDPGTHRVPGDDLAGFPRTAMVGIPGAPDSLPGTDRVLGPPWTICSEPEPDPAGQLRAVTSLRLGEPVPGGAPLGERGLLVRDAEDGTRYLVWRSHRYRIAGPDPDRVIQSLYGVPGPEALAGPPWLDALPAGEDLAPIELADLGAPSPAVRGYRIGDVLYHPITGGEQHYLVRADGLDPLTDLEQRVQTGEYQVEPVPIGAAAANALPTSAEGPASTSGAAALPLSAPELARLPADRPVPLCAETADARVPPVVSYGGELSPAAGAIPTGGASPAGTRLADLVRVPPSRVAVVRALPSATASTGAFQLVTDVGLRFPVPSEEVLGILGYPPAAAVDMPAGLVQRIPAGPTLDPAAALQPAPLPPG